MARAIATAWRSPPESEAIGVVGGISLLMPTSLRRSRATSFMAALSIRFKKRGRLIGSRPRNRLRAMDNSVTKAESW